MLYCIIYFFLFFSLCFGEEGKIYTIEQACIQKKKNNLSLPKPQSDGRIQTLNEKGASSPVLDEVTRAFVAFVDVDKTALEIGGAYGGVLLSSPGLLRCKHYILNDLDDRHLFIAASRLNQKYKSKTQKISLWHADIRESVNPVKVDAILAARVLHFFSPEGLSKSIKNMFTMLNPGGRVFSISITPYVKRFEKVIPVYEERKVKGDLFPGYVENLRLYLNADVTTKSQQLTLPKEPFLFLDEEVLRREFEKNGFKIIECRLMSLGYKSKTWCLDGREFVMIIAEKPFPQNATIKNTDKEQSCG